MEQIYSNSKANYVIGNLLNNPQLIYRKEYQLSKDDFQYLPHRILFVAINMLANEGVSNITPKEIGELLENYPSQLNVLKDELDDWVGFVDTIKELSSEDSFDFYYNSIRKYTLIRKYRDNGFDISKFWDFEKTDEINNAELDKYEIKDIIKYYDNTNADIKSEFSNSIDGSEVIIAGSGFNDFLDEMEQTPLLGSSFLSEYLNGLTRGQVKGQLSIFASPSGCGKAQPIDTIIPTPNGNRKLGDLKVGDYVFDRQGNPTKILGVYPQGKIDCYEVELFDGRKTYCNNEHLWNVTEHARSTTNATAKTITLDEMIKMKNEGKTISIDANKAVEYPKKDFRIDPYVFGSFLGNGCCKQQQLTLSSNDVEQVNEVAKLIGGNAKKQSEKNYNWKFEYKNINDKPTTTQKNNKYFLTKYLFEGYEDAIVCKASEKYIPDEYKYSSIEQRYTLLQGLFDTDGCISCSKSKRSNYKKFNVTYSSTSYRLCKDIMEILFSLGHSCSLREDKREKEYKGEKRQIVCYTVSVFMDNKYKHKIFRLSRKKNRALEALNYKSKRVYDYMPIKSINKMNYQTDMVCIYVDNDEHLYLTNDYIVTHNTTIAISNIVNLCATKIWSDEVGDYIDNPYKTMSGGLYIEYEMELVSEVTSKFISSISGIPCNVIFDGFYDKKIRERLNKANEILQESNIHLVYMPTYTCQSIEDTIKEHKNKYNIDIVCFDYISDCPELNAELTRQNGGVSLRNDQILLTLSSRLKDYARRYDVVMYSMVQTNGNIGTSEIIGAECFAGARALVNKTDIAGVLMPLRPKEEKLTEEIMTRQKGFHKAPNYIFHMVKMRFSKYPMSTKVWCHIDLGTGKITDCFCTDCMNKPINVEPLKLIQKTIDNN